MELQESSLARCRRVRSGARQGSEDWDHAVERMEMSSGGQANRVWLLSLFYLLFDPVQVFACFLRPCSLGILAK